LQSTPNGDQLVVGHLSKNGSKKVRNVRNDSRVAVMIVSPARPGHPISRVAFDQRTARIVEGGAPELLKELARNPRPRCGFVPEGARPGFLTRIRIEHVGGIGPWATWTPEPSAIVQCCQLL